MLLKIPPKVINIRAKLLTKLLHSAIYILLCIFLYLTDICVELLARTLCLKKLIVLHFSLLFADMNLFVKCLVYMHEAILLLMLHFYLIVLELIHDSTLHPLCLKLQVLLDELLLLEQPELLGLLQLADLLGYLAFSLSCKLLPEGLDLPLV